MFRICHELNELFAELGYLQYRTFGYGHSFGFCIFMEGGWFELREDIDTVLEENNCFNGTNDNDSENSWSRWI